MSAARRGGTPGKWRQPPVRGIDGRSADAGDAGACAVEDWLRSGHQLVDNGSITDCSIFGIVSACVRFPNKG
jgi:hypothetical protein